MLRGGAAFVALELKTESLAPLSKLSERERFLPSLESGFSEPIKREDCQEPLYILEAPIVIGN